MLQVKIRRADAGDAEMLTNISTQTFIDTFAADNDPADMALYLQQSMSQQVLTSELADTANYFFLALYDNAVVGYAKVRANTEQGVDEHPALEIERIYVRHQYHGHQVGAALMQHCLGFAQQTGCSVVWLGVWEHNHKAVRFYEKWGFVRFGQHPFKLGNDLQTDILMKKDIA